MTTVVPAGHEAADASSAADASIASAAASATESITTLRTQIDALDAAIVRLVAERGRLSTRIQTARVNAGGARVELGRERVILDTYRTGLGPHGPNLADAVLQVCRGAR